MDKTFIFPVETNERVSTLEHETYTLRRRAYKMVSDVYRQMAETGFMTLLVMDGSVRYYSTPDGISILDDDEVSVTVLNDKSLNLEHKNMLARRLTHVYGRSTHLLTEAQRIIDEIKMEMGP
jgi:hypothetical protein